MQKPKPHEQALIHIVAATFAVHEVQRNCRQKGKSNLWWLRHHYASDGIPISSADLGSPTEKHRQAFSRSLRLLAEDNFISVLQTNIHGSRVHLTPKGHDEACLLCDLLPLGQITFWLEDLVAACEAAGKVPESRPWISEAAVVQAVADDVTEEQISSCDPAIRPYYQTMQVDMAQLSIAGLVEALPNTQGLAFYRLTEAGLSLSQTPGVLSDGYRHREGKYKPAISHKELWPIVDGYQARYLQGNYATTSEIAPLPLPASEMDDMIVLLGGDDSDDDDELEEHRNNRQVTKA